MLLNHSILIGVVQISIHSLLYLYWRALAARDNEIIIYKYIFI